MKITHIIYSFTTGGSETMLVDIANEQVKQAEVSIVIINKIYNDVLVAKIDNRVAVYFIKRKAGSKNPVPVFRLNLLLLKMGADVLHCHNHNIVPLLLPLLRRKSVLTIHDVGVKIIYLKMFHKLFAISRIVQDDIKTRSGLEATLVYNGICTDKVKQSQGYANDSVFKIVIISRLIHLKKGQHLAIEALYILKQKAIKNIQLDLIGEGISDAFLKDLVRKFNLGDQINFLGLKDREYVYSHLKDYDLLIQPSLYEGFGLTVVEGMSAKVPVLVSDVDGPMEVIENRKYGFHFKSGNAEDLAKQLKLIVGQYTSKEQKQLVAMAHQHVVSNFSIIQTAQNYIDNY